MPGSLLKRGKPALSVFEIWNLGHFLPLLPPPIQAKQDFSEDLQGREGTTGKCSVEPTPCLLLSGFHFGANIIL
jgi:hypothetical protein